jgi:hypothetical protein
MNDKRKAAESVCLKFIAKIMPGSANESLYKTKFASMSDEEFDSFINDLDKGKTNLCLIAPNFGSPRLDFARNLSVMEELGHDPYQRIWIPATNNQPRYLSNNPQLVLDMPVRRQAQMVDHKLSVAEDNGSVDDFTGQPTGRSKSTTISYPEAQVLAGRGKESTLTEFLKFRGGDQKGFAAMNTLISRTGGVSQKALEPYSSKVKSTQVLDVLFKAMHIQTTL